MFCLSDCNCNSYVYNVNFYFKENWKNMKTKEAIEHFGGIKNLADALGIWPQTVYQWGEKVPKGRAYQLQVITKEKLKVNEGEK